MFLNVMEGTPDKKCFNSGDWKQNSGIDFRMFGLTMVDYGHKRTCSHIWLKYWPSFKSMQYKTLGMERKLTTLHFMVVSLCIILIM